MNTIIVSSAIIACFAIAANAQELTGTQDPDINGEARTYSQAENLTHDLPLELLALNNPGLFENLAVLDASGREIGTVTEIARDSSDQSLHAVVNLASGNRAGLPLQELALAAFAYYDPAQSLSDQPYVATEFEQVTQYQAGHSAWGSLTDPAIEPSAPPQGDFDQATEPVGLPQQPPIEQQVQAEPSPLQTPVQPPASSSGAAQTSYIASGSPVVQLAIIRPDAMQGKQLLDETAKPLGEIAHIAKNIADQRLYAVVDMNGEPEQAVVKLDALSIGKLAYLGDISEASQKFAEGKFVPVAGQ